MSMTLEEQIVDSWRIHNRIHLYLLESLDVGALATQLAKGKAVSAQFAHIHNVRLMWLKAAQPELLEGLEKLEGDLDAEKIRAGLTASGEAVATLLAKAIESGERVKNFKPHTVAFLGYLISHESHHRGQIEISLRQAGTPISDKISYGLWEWGSR
jgi:uncharacterized damage-inducible protein DinB